MSEKQTSKPEEESKSHEIKELKSDSSSDSFKSLENNSPSNDQPTLSSLKADFSAALSAEKEYQNLEKSEELKTKGNEMFTAQEYIEALDFYNQAIYYCPDSYPLKLAIYYHNKGMSLWKMNKQQEAIDAFTKSVELNPDYLKPRYQRMKLYKDTEKYT